MLVRFWTKFAFFDINPPNTKVMNIRPAEAEFFHAERWRANRKNEADIRISQLYKRLQKYSTTAFSHLWYFSLV